MAGSKVGRPRPETEARGARRSPRVSRAPAGCGIAARRPPRWSSLGRGNPPGLGNLNPNRSSGPSRLPAAPGRRLGPGSRWSDARPQAGANKGAPGGSAPSRPAALSAAGSPRPRRVVLPPLPDAGAGTDGRGPGSYSGRARPGPSAPVQPEVPGFPVRTSVRSPPRGSLPLSALQRARRG